MKLPNFGSRVFFGKQNEEKKKTERSANITKLGQDFIKFVVNFIKFAVKNFINLAFEILIEFHGKNFIKFSIIKLLNNNCFHMIKLSVA